MSCGTRPSYKWGNFGVKLKWGNFGVISKTKGYLLWKVIWISNVIYRTNIFHNLTDLMMSLFWTVCFVQLDRGFHIIPKKENFIFEVNMNIKCHSQNKYIHRLITAYLLLRVNFDKIMQGALRFWCIKCMKRKGECIEQASKLKPKCIIYHNSRAQSKYTVVSLIYTRRK